MEDSTILPLPTVVMTEETNVVDTNEIPYWAVKSGVAPIKSEYILWHKMKNGRPTNESTNNAQNDDEAEGRSSASTPSTSQRVNNRILNRKIEEVELEVEKIVETVEVAVSDVSISTSTIIEPTPASAATASTSISTTTTTSSKHPLSDPSTPLDSSTSTSTSTPLNEEETGASEPREGEPEPKKIRLSGAQKKAAARAKENLLWEAKMVAKRLRKAEKKGDIAAGGHTSAVGEGIGTGAGEGEGEGREKMGGQNKGRTFNNRAGAINLCTFTARGEICPRESENKCRQSHDLISYLNSRPLDVPISLPINENDLSLENRVFEDRICPIFISLGKCTQGFKCRFANSHMRKVDLEKGELGMLGSEWTLIVDEEKVKFLWENRGEGLKEIKDRGEMNVISADQMRALRGAGRTKEEQFPLTAIYLASINEPMDYHGAEDSKSKGGKGKRGGKGGRGGRGGKNGGGGRDEKDSDSMSIVEEEEGTSLYVAVDGDDDVEVGEETAAVVVASTSTLETTITSTTDTNINIDIDSHPSRSFIPDLAPIRATEKRRLDFRGKLYLAPLTTTGNLPFRRLCGDFGNDISCSEMGLAQEFMGGNGREWSLVRRHPSEKIFGIQVCGSRPQILVPTAEAIVKSCDIDFLDVNCGCPIDLVFNKGAGSALLGHAAKLGKSLVGMSQVLGEIPLTIKIRTGIAQNTPVAHKLVTKMQTEWGVSSVTLHGRSRNQRYKNKADYGYIAEVAKTLRETAADNGLAPIPIFGNGDAYDYRTYYENMEASGVDGIMIARGALVKPWIFTEIKERRDFDISSRERLDMIGTLAKYGLEHWGSDTMGINTTRRFLCEALSFQHRYVPVGILERFPSDMNERPFPYRGRDELETLLSSDVSEDWVKITNMFLGPPEDNWSFTAKHKSNSYEDPQG